MRESRLRHGCFLFCLLVVLASVCWLRRRLVTLFLGRVSLLDIIFLGYLNGYVVRGDANGSFLAAPSGLLIAAIVAAIPLGGECIGIYQCEFIMHPGISKMDNKVDLETTLLTLFIHVQRLEA